MSNKKNKNINNSFKTAINILNCCFILCFLSIYKNDILMNIIIWMEKNIVQVLKPTTKAIILFFNQQRRFYYPCAIVEYPIQQYSNTTKRTLPVCDLVEQVQL